LLEGCRIVTLRIPDRLLVTSAAFGPGLPAARVAAAIGRGLQAGGLPAPDLCPIDASDAQNSEPGVATQTVREQLDASALDVREQLDALGFDVRMRRARAVIIAAARLEEVTLAGSVTFEIATRARQGGVPAYAVTGENALSAFDARMLDLQLILEAGTARALTAAGRKLARLV
jgi:hypothetical protein